MLSNCGHDENNRYAGGVSGDQTGTEWAKIPFYCRPWTECYYHPNDKVNELVADLLTEGAENDNCGYDQNQRLTFWNQLKQVGYRPKNIKVKCEGDCSSTVLACVKAAGYILGINALKNINHQGYTGNEGAILQRAGYIKTTDSKYLTSDKYLKRGYILNYPYHHTAGYIGDGKVSTSNESAGSVTASGTVASGTVAGNVLQGQRWLNANYGTTLIKYKGKKLKEDGDYGTESRAGALCIWKDVVNRKYGYALNPANENFLASCKEAAKDAQISNGASGTLTYIAEFILSAKGYYKGAMDALFGSELEGAVKAFQKVEGLSVDGIVGPDTWYALFN